jgi:hypothetical protein
VDLLPPSCTQIKELHSTAANSCLIQVEKWRPEEAVA